MKPAAPGLFTRRPFTLDRVEALLGFCAAHPAHSTPPALRERFLTTLTTGTDGVVELVDGAGTAALAATLDAVQSAARCAVFEIMALRPDVSLVAVGEALLEPAERFVGAGEQRGLEVHLPPKWQPFAPRLEARGYGRAYTMYEMAAAPRRPIEPPLPGPQWRWSRATVADAGPYHAVVNAAMGPVPGAYLSPFEDFRETLTRGAPDDLLWCGDRLAGFACHRRGDDGVGEVNLIGRHPDFRGRGLGPILLARAMNRLVDAEAQVIHLDVSATNAAAVELYRGVGFRTRFEVHCYRRMLDA